MYFRQGTRRILCALPRSHFLGSNFSANYHLNASWTAKTRSFGIVGFQVQRYGSFPDTEHPNLSKVDDLMTFIGSSLHHPRGDSHCWFNVNVESGNILKEKGVFLVLVGEYFESSLEASQHAVKMFANAKLLQQRYSFLQVLALQYTEPKCCHDISSNMIWRIMKEYVTFPILLCNKNAYQMESIPCYLIFDGLKKHAVYPGDSDDIKLLDRAIKDLNTQNMKGAGVDVLKGSWVKPLFTKEPSVCSAMRSLLFSFPGCISIDETGNRLFISDVNHHRIISLDKDGKFLDAIGSSPGYEDGEFENAKLMRPAASLYDASEDILYFADSENHAIRRADMSRRVVETVIKPNGDTTKSKGWWNRIISNIWRKRNPRLKSQELNLESFSLPWHILKSSNNEIFVLNQSCELLWIVDVKAGFVKEVVKESSKISEICQQMILDKCMPLSSIPADWLHHQLALSYPKTQIPCAAVISSFAKHLDNIIFCDAVGQAVVKFKKGSTSPESFQFSNFGVLGLPYWLTSSLERVYSVYDTPDADYTQCFKLLPGIVTIELNVDIPQDSSLVEHPKEGSVWCQVRGAAIEVSGEESKEQSSEKASLAQQWYDELDNLVFEQEESTKQDIQQDKRSLEEVQDGRLRIQRTIKISPGTSEAIIQAALYLRLQEKEGSHLNTPQKKAERIGDILEPKRASKRDLLIRSLLVSQRAIEEVIFVRTMQVRLKFETEDHPKAENTKGIVFTDSSVKVDVTL